MLHVYVKMATKPAHEYQETEKKGKYKVPCEHSDLMQVKKQTL